MRRRLTRLRVAFAAPLLRRLGFHVGRMTSNVDRGFFLRLFVGLFGIVLVAALLVTVIEGPRDSPASSSPPSASFYWGVTTVMGSGDASYVTHPAASSSPGCSCCSGWRSSPRSPARSWAS